MASKSKNSNTTEKPPLDLYKEIRKWHPETILVPPGPPISDIELSLLIETYCFTKAKSLSIHQQQIYAALAQLRILRCMEKN